MARAARKSLYSVHPGVKMMQDWVATLKDKTGRSLEEWITLVKKDGPADVAKQREWLKSKHKLGTNSAWWIAERAAGRGGEDADPESYLRAAAGWVEAQYAGKKQPLRPLYDRLLEMALALGSDVRACPCKTIVPLYRRHVFAEIKPGSNTRIDLGLALKKAAGKIPKRLLPTGGAAKGDRITHRIPISAAGEIDDEVRRWLRVAYDLDEKG
jgi:hypothetical protein